MLTANYGTERQAVGALLLGPVDNSTRRCTSLRPIRRLTIGVPMTASLIFVCVFVLVGLAGAPGYVGISWVFAWLGLFLTVTVLLLLMPGRRRPETSPRIRHQS